jgi:hypothetical protein
MNVPSKEVHQVQTTVPRPNRELQNRRLSISTICSTVLAGVWAVVVPGMATAGQQGLPDDAAEKSSVVTKITAEINVDGVLDEAVWESSPALGELTQREPQEGAAPTERTRVTLLHDADYLYIGVLAYDSEPRRVIGTQMARDGALNADDRVEIILDTYRDQRNAFYFATNPVGALVDGLLFANGQSNMEWDAVWDVRTRRTEQGWSAEFAIPFKSLAFPAGRTVWGFNIMRFVQRKLEESRWSGARLQTQFFQVSEAGTITNLDGLTQGIGVSVRPFTGGRWLHMNGRDTVTGKPGLDMFYNVTPSLKLTATVNTDFGETEVDTRQINLSRFSLFFPEKRAFFLEDAGVFSFSNSAVRQPNFLAPTRAEVIPFFSRQVGLLAGEEVPVDVGVKLTGKAGRTDLGLLDVRTRDVGAVSDKNFFVARVKRNLFQQSHIGLIMADGNPARSLSSQTYGADLRLATSQFLGSKHLVFNAYGLKTNNEGITGDDVSYGVSAEYPNDLIELDFISREIQQNFRPALGFVGRRNVRVLRIGGRFNPRPRNFLDVQQFFTGAYYNRFTRLDNDEVESWDLMIPTIDFHFRSGDGLHSLYSPDFMYERLFAPFEIYPGVFIPPGEYRFTRWTNHIMTAGKRRVQANVKWISGNYWSGEAHELQTTWTYKIPPGFTFSLNTNHTWATLPQGNFAARIYGANVNYAASSRISFSNLIQYDNQSRNMGWQSRARWIIRPGDDLFFVFSQGWIQDPEGGYRFAAQDSKVSSKLQYTFRF